MTETAEGISTDFNELHCEKAPFPITETEDGILIDVKDSH